MSLVLAFTGYVLVVAALCAITGANRFGRAKARRIAGMPRHDV